MWMDEAIFSAPDALTMPVCDQAGGKPESVISRRHDFAPKSLGLAALA